MEENPNDWSFAEVFATDESRINFITDTLKAFEQFPPNTHLNCNDFYSIFSVVCEQIPYTFMVFVCECVDPSISSGTIMSHRIAFGNFLLAFPACILYPHFMYRMLTFFKTADRLRTGIITREKFINVLRSTFMSFIPPEQQKKIEHEFEEEEEEESIPKSNTPADTDSPRYRVPDMSLMEEVEIATKDLEQSSVQTLLFVMWQKDSALLQCKAIMNPEQFENMESASEEQADENEFEDANYVEEEEKKEEAQPSEPKPTEAPKPFDIPIAQPSPKEKISKESSTTYSSVNGEEEGEEEEVPQEYQGCRRSGVELLMNDYK